VSDIAEAVAGLLPAITRRLSVSALKKVDLPDAVLTGDQLELRVLVRVDKAGFHEPYDAKADSFKGALSWEASAKAHTVEIVNVTTRAELDKAWAERLSAEEDGHWEDGQRS
jgi:environmental stress-induced protein Ves